MLTETVSSYVTFCVDLVISTKHVVIFPNNKPWVTADLKSAIKKNKKIFFSGDPQEKKAASKEVKAEIENKYLNRDLRSEVSNPILCTVYLSYIESLLTFSFVCWFGSLSVKDKNCLGCVVKVCSKTLTLHLHFALYSIQGNTFVQYS